MRLETEVNGFLHLERSFNDAETLFQLSQEMDDPDSLKEAGELTSGLTKLFDEAEFRKLLAEEADSKNAIVTINAGAGGTESQDWAQMLFRMIQRWAQDKGFKVSIMDALMGE